MKPMKDIALSDGSMLKPKKLGGLGPLNLEFFSRALRLRWVWYQWRESDRTSATSDAPINEVDLQLFRVSTVVTIGNGHTTQFWNSSWLDGKAPRDIAPNLYDLAWRKHKTVHEEIIEHNWTRGLWRMNSVTEMEEFLLLWDSVQNITLNDQPDAIAWRWSANGEYSAKTAYLAQFRGSYCTFQPTAIWRAQTEGKHRFFTWLLLQNRILTADRLLARNWPCNPVCPLCQVEPETATHLCLQCPFALQVGKRSVTGQVVWLLFHWPVQSFRHGGVHPSVQPRRKRDDQQQQFSFTRHGIYGKSVIGGFSMEFSALSCKFSSLSKKKFNFDRRPMARRVSTRSSIVHLRAMRSEFIFHHVILFM
nr:uncharacterized protein LOC117838539 isoform X1 [Setaria viridis]